jgi:hypothetical protein
MNIHPRVTFAELLLEIRRRAQSAPQDVPRLSAIELAAREVLGISDEDYFDPQVFDALTPEAVMQIDLLLELVGNDERMPLIRKTLARRST